MPDDDDELEQADIESDEDLAQLEGVDPDELRELIASEPDPATDGLECDHGEALRHELEGDDGG